MTFCVSAHLLDDHLGQAATATSRVPLGIDMAGNDDAMNPMELLLAALSACMIKGTNRLIPLLNLDVTGMDIALEATRQDDVPGVSSIRYDIVVSGSLTDREADTLHKNLLSFGTVTSTIARGTDLQGTIRVARGNGKK